MKFDTKTNLNMQNSMVVFNASVLDWKYPFWANFVQKTKIGSFSRQFQIWYLVLLKYQEFNGDVHCFCF